MLNVSFLWDFDNRFLLLKEKTNQKKKKILETHDTRKGQFCSGWKCPSPPLKDTRSFTQIQTHTEGQNSHKQNTFLSATNSITKNHPLWVEIN